MLPKDQCSFVLAASTIGLLAAAVFSADRFAPSADPFETVKNTEAQRIETIARVSPAVVCVFDQTRDGGGAGVLIDKQGYGLTNFHVVMNMLATRRGYGGLSDGKIYTLEVLGLDITGDVAMFKLAGRDSFAFATLGDSDGLRLGQRVLAMGNPFALAYDYTPTVTLGVITGLHRYQYGRGDALVYTDCIQTDAAINPGNSGGPLFDRTGDLVGINGRASFEQRGRVNVGLAYAISINQIRRFIPALRVGLLVEHGSLGATFRDAPDGTVEVDQIIENSPASAAGIELGDRLSQFDSVPITSANQFASLLGTYPANWPVSLRLQRAEKKWQARVRLERQPVREKDSFQVDAAVNQRAVRRVLNKARAAIGIGPGSPAIRAVEYRADTSDRDNEPKSSARVVRSERSGELTNTTLNAKNKPLAVLATDGQEAWKFLGDQTIDLAGIEAAVLKLEHAVFQVLFFADLAKEKSAWRHVGGDEVREKLVEVIEISRRGDTIRFAFDAVTFQPIRVIRIAPDEAVETEIRLGAFRKVGDRMLPHRLEFYENLEKRHERRIENWKIFR